jgi:hypothetical protein
MLARRFWAWTTQKRPTWRESRAEAAVAFTVLGATGTATMTFVRPGLKQIGLEGSLMEGPNSYRVASVLIVSPMYALTLVTVGTLAGRHRYFGGMTTRILGRFLPFAAPILCPPAKAALRAAM